MPVESDGYEAASEDIDRAVDPDSNAYVVQSIDLSLWR